MNIPPLVIIQARMNSARLPGKMLLKLHGETLIARAVRLAGEAFGAEHVVVAIPFGDAQASCPLYEELRHIGATIHAVPRCAESDVLGRFHAIAHGLRWHPDSVIVRWTPDDPFKVPAACQRVARGERLPVEVGAEAFTLAMLDRAHEDAPRGSSGWEHITHALFPTAPSPYIGPKQMTVDTPEDWARVLAENPEPA